MEGSGRTRQTEASRSGRTRRKAPACPPIGMLMRYGERAVRVIAEASGQSLIIESVDEDGRLPEHREVGESGGDGAGTFLAGMIAHPFPRRPAVSALTTD